MFELQEEDHKPRLQLEYVGGGPGSRVKTAIGTGDDGAGIDPSVLSDPPWWFVLINARLDYKTMFCMLPLEVALSLLEKAEVPPLYRLALGLEWGFLDPQRDGFSRGDLAAIMRVLQLLHAPFVVELRRIEKRSTYQIWRKLGSKLQLMSTNYWAEDSKMAPQAKKTTDET